MDPRPSLGALRAFLLRGRNVDGGWGYRPGKGSRLEPTCWATLALARDAADAGVLAGWPTQNGLLLERAGGSANYAFHGVALLALHAFGVEHAVGNSALLAALEQVKGDALPSTEAQRQDNSLRGWSWIEGTFSWAEPTAWCLLAIKKWSRAHGIAVEGSRVDVAERLLRDRVCTPGGWNYGNSNVLGQELKPYVPTTAIALLALQDRRELPEVRRSLEFLERHAAQERSSMALALGVLALRVYGRPAPALGDALLEQLPTTIELGNHMGAAMALLALGEDDGHAAIRL